MISPEPLYMKNAINELSFPLVTHMTYFDTRFGCYGFLKLGYGAELFWTTWTLERNPSFKGPKMSRSGQDLIMDSSLLAHLFNAYSSTRFQ
jgi:hypothetical protein